MKVLKKYFNRMPLRKQVIFVFLSGLIQYQGYSLRQARAIVRERADLVGWAVENSDLFWHCDIPYWSDEILRISREQSRTNS